MITRIKFPALFIHQNTSDINALKAKEMVGDIRFLKDKNHINKYEKNVIVIDRKGNKYHQVGIRQISKINLWLSIKYAGKIVKVEPILKEEKEYITLPELKSLLIETINRKPKKWLPLGPLNIIQEYLDEANSYVEVMHIFNTKI